MVYNPHIRVMGVNAPGWHLLATLGGPGILKGIGVANSDGREHYIKIEYDGVVIAKGAVAGSTAAYENTGITFDVPFDSQISIYARDRPATSNSVHRYWISLVTGHQPVNTNP